MSRFFYHFAAAFVLGTAPAFAQVAGEAPSTDVPGSSVVAPTANEEIVPASARTVMGGSSNSIPWSWTPCHFMQPFLESELPQSSYPIRCIAFRTNNRVDTGAEIDLEIWMGYTSYDQSTITTTYASNYNVPNQSPVLVFKRKKVKLANMIQNTNPLFFQYQLPLDTPFIWVPVSGRNLLWECKIYGNNNSNASFSFFPDNESGTGTTTSRLYSSNDANATTATITRNYGPVLRFGPKCLVNADAVDFGRGSTTKPVPGAPYIIPPAWNRNYPDSRGYPRGFSFQAPVDFIITGFDVPNEAQNPMQTVALYLLTANPPAYASEYLPKASDLVYYAQDQKANTVLTPKAPIPVKKGQWVCVLGVTHGSALTVTSSYSNTGAQPIQVLGQTAPTWRLLSQHAIRTNSGLGGIATNGNTGNRGRVNIHVAGQAIWNAAVPEMTTTARPLVGQTAELTVTPAIKNAQAGVMALGTTRLPAVVPTPFGDLLIPPLMTLAFPGAGGKVPLPIPNNQAFLGVKLTFQGFIFDFTNSSFGGTNGTEWTLGEQ